MLRRAGRLRQGGWLKGREWPLVVRQDMAGAVEGRDDGAVEVTWRSGGRAAVDHPPGRGRPLGAGRGVGRRGPGRGGPPVARDSWRTGATWTLLASAMT